jgi:hypothetical protein
MLFTDDRYRHKFRLFESPGMGSCFSSLCPKSSKDDLRPDQYLNLVVSKPSPVTLETVDLSGSGDTDVPLFPQVLDDPDQSAIPKVEQIYSSDDDQFTVKKPHKFD